MKRLVDAVREWLRYDDIVAERGYDGGENDQNWDNAKTRMARLVGEPLEVYETVMFYDLEQVGQSVSTAVFATREEAVDWSVRRFKENFRILHGGVPDDSETEEFSRQMGRCDSFVDSADGSSVTYAIHRHDVEVRHG